MHYGIHVGRGLCLSPALSQAQSNACPLGGIQPGFAEGTKRRVSHSLALSKC